VRRSLEEAAAAGAARLGGKETSDGAMRRRRRWPITRASAVLVGRRGKRTVSDGPENCRPGCRLTERQSTMAMPTDSRHRARDLQRSSPSRSASPVVSPTVRLTVPRHTGTPALTLN